MTDTQTPAGTIGLLIMSERSHGEYFHVRVYPVRLDTEGYGSVRNICGGSSYSDDAETMPNGFYLPDLMIDSQGDMRPGRERKLYGFDCVYKPHFVKAREATRMAKTLTTIERKLEKLNEKRGYVRSFGEYVGRIAEVMGITEMVTRPKGQEHYSMHSDGHYTRYSNLGDGVQAIESLVWRWAEEGKEQAAAAS